MSTPTELLEQWKAVALTKFRVPRLRRDIIPRPALLERLADSIDANPVTLVCAPGGSGKTTLLAQLGSAPIRDFTVLWIGIDADDNDANRLFTALVQAVRPLSLSWEVDLGTLLTGISASKGHARAALAALVNALCTTTVPRVVLVLDDLHKLENPEVFELLDSLIERLPDHVAVVLGSRVEPPLSLARWRAYGELGVFTAEDLQFSSDEAGALGSARFGRTFDEGAIRGAVARTHGWAAGLMLLLQSRAGLQTEVTEGDGADSNRHLFAYLAQEVLEDLPADLQDFLLRCSILLYLDPRLCNVLSGRNDSRQVLETLYRRNLFLTALDEVTPVLRFHDLFREFLEAELARRDPTLKRELHERAAAAEKIDSRAIYHLLAAQRWNEAMQRIVHAGEERLAHGGISTVERWIDSIPEQVRSGNPLIPYLRGTCAWFRWDWPRAKRELAAASDQLQAPEHVHKRARALLHLVDALNSSGERPAALQRLETLENVPLDELGQAELALQRAWCLTPAGEPEGVLKHMQDFVERVERDPRTLCAATAERIHPMLIGIPGIADVFERFYNAYLQSRGESLAPWHISALTVGTWVHMWRGRRTEALASLEEAIHLQRQVGAVRLVVERLGQLRALMNVALLEHDTALKVIHTHVAGMQEADMAGHNAIWMRPYRYGMARAFWVAGNTDAFREVLPYLIEPARPGEWPFVPMAAAIVSGQAAMLAKQWDVAVKAFRDALRAHDRLRLPLIHADPRINLAYALLQLGRKSDAWEAMRPAYEEIIRERAIGILLLEARPIVNEVLEIVPADLRRTVQHTALLTDWARWNETQHSTSAPRNNLLGPLSEREYEVLAEVASGASNKHIARELSLSLHTVKRHIANILDKLGCDSRGQAADLFRRATAA